jgi:alpha-soluble NSF attachment protein
MSKLAKNESEATEYYTQAAQAYRKVNPEEALRVFNLAASLHMEQNRFSTAAKIYKSIGELCEEDRNYSGAVEAYNHAAECYIAEDASTSANQMLLKVAHYSAVQEDFKKAIELYEQVALSSLDNQLLSWGAKEHYFKAMLCHLAMASKSGSSAPSWLAESELAWDKYKGNYPAIEGTRECKLIDQVLSSLAEGEIEKLQDAIVDYDTFCKLDDWKATILLQIKNSLKVAPSANDADFT